MDLDFDLNADFDFDCSEWSDEEILLLMQHMYLHFDFPTKYNICMTTLRNFLFQVYKNYNEVPFHNFRHSFCVTQMVNKALFYYLYILARRRCF
jgi:hypothetical protein